MSTEAAAPFVVIGAGLAGAKAAEALRDAGFEGPITLLGAEVHLPYERPPLSKGFLLGSEEQTKMLVHDADLSGVLYLRTLDDCLALKAAFTPGARVVIIGAGWIGLETAAAARAAGADVVVLEHAGQPLLNVLGSRLGEVFADLHRSHDVDLRCGVSVTELLARQDDPAQVGAVALADGDQVPADVVVVGVGVTPN